MGTPGPQNGAPADEESSPLASLWRQARAETASADKRARQGAQPLPANGNGQHGQRGVQPASPTSSTDVPRRTERRDMDVRIAWRDAELFRLSKREQQWKCALVMLCWRMQAAQLAARNLAVFRFLQRRRQAGCKAHLLAWWAVVLLQQRPFPSSPLGGASDGSGEEDAAASCNANGKAKLRALQRQSSDTLAGRANAAEPAYPHGQAAEGVTAPAEEADALGQQAADLKIIQRHVGALQQELATANMRADTAEQECERLAAGPGAALGGQEICALRARLAEAVRENETLQESVATASRDISELATLICTHDHSAQAAFLQSCISSAHSTQLHGGASHQASCEGREGGKRQSVATADIEGGEENSHVGPRAASASSVDIGAAARDLAAMMLLRYRFLEAEKQQATVELEQQLHSALTLVRTGKQELAACYEQMEELAALSGRAHEYEELVRARVMEEVKHVVHERDRLVEEREHLLQEKRQVDEERQHLRSLCVQNSEKERQREREDAERLAHERESARERELQEKERAERESQAVSDQERCQRDREILQSSNKALLARCRHLERELTNFTASTCARKGEARPSSAHVDWEVHDTNAMLKRPVPHALAGAPFGRGGEESHAGRLGRGAGDSGGEVSREVPSLTANTAARRHQLAASTSTASEAGRVRGKGGSPVSNSSTHPARNASLRGSNPSLRSCPNYSSSACVGLNYRASPESGSRRPSQQSRRSPGSGGVTNVNGGDTVTVARARSSSPGDEMEEERDSLRLSLRCLRPGSPRSRSTPCRRISQSPPPDDLGKALDEACKELESLEAQLMAL